MPREAPEKGDHASLRGRGGSLPVRPVKTGQHDHREVVTGDAPGKLVFPDTALARVLFGEHGANLKLIEKELSLQIHSRGNTLVIEGAPADTALAEKVLRELYDLIREGFPIYGQDVDFAIRIISGGKTYHSGIFFSTRSTLPPKKRSSHPRAWRKKNISTPSDATTSYSVSDLQERGRPIWPWPWRYPRWPINR